MTDQHPITPPPELIKQWLWEFYGPESMPGMAPGEMVLHIAAVAARWGADMEREACCEWLAANDWAIPGGECLRDLRAARRPEPPSLKEKALLQLDTLNADLGMHGLGCDLSQIRRALESMPD